MGLTARRIARDTRALLSDARARGLMSNVSHVRVHGVATWQVELDGGTSTWAPYDEDEVIRKERPAGGPAKKARTG